MPFLGVLGVCRDVIALLDHNMGVFWTLQLYVFLLDVVKGGLGVYWALFPKA